MTGAGLIPEAGATCEDDRPIGFYDLGSARALFLAKRAIDSAEQSRVGSGDSSVAGLSCGADLPEQDLANKSSVLLIEEHQHG